MASVGLRSGFGGFGDSLGQVLVRVGVDTKQLDAGLAKARGETEAAGGRFQKFGALASAGFAIAGVAAAKFAVDAIQSAQEHERVLAQLQIAVGNNTKAFEDQATALQSLTGFQDEEVLAADTVLARFELTDAQIQELIPHVLDYARATGGDAAQAAGSLGKALLGNTRALKTIGIDFTATGDKAKDLATITKLLEDRVGGAAKAFGQTFAGKLAILAAKFDDVKEEVGAALIPALEDLVDVAQKLIPIIGPLVSEAFSSAARTASELLAVVEPLVSILDAIPGPANEAGESTSGLATAWQKLVEFNPVHVLSEYNAWVLKTIGVTKEVGIQSAEYTGTLADLEGALTKSTGAQQDAADAAKEATDALKDEKEAMRALAPAATTLIGSILNLKGAQKDLAAAQRDSTTTAAELRDKQLAVIDAFLGVKSNLSDLIEKMKDGKATQQDVINKFQDLATKAGIGKGAIEDLTGILQNYIDKIKSIPTSVTTRVFLTGDSVTDTGVGGNGGGGGSGGGGGGGGNGGSPQQGVRDVHIHAGTVIGNSDEFRAAVSDAVYQAQRRRQPA